MSDTIDKLWQSSTLAKFPNYPHFIQFHEAYDQDLKAVEAYLEHAGSDLGGKYASMYQHWYRALRDLRQGIYLLTKRIALPSPKRFLEALKIFSFGGAAAFIRDIAIICNLRLESDWATRFQNHIMLLLQAHDQILANQLHHQR